VVSHKKRKKEASRAGLTEPELQMLELLEEIIDKFRWLKVLAHTQSYIIREKLKLDDKELDHVLRAATRTLDEDSTLRRWEDGLARLKGELVEGRRGIRRERKRLRREDRDARKGERRAEGEA